MAKISLEIIAVDSNMKKNTTTVSYINPAAENAQLKEFAQKLMELTTDTHESTTKITKESVI